MFVPLVRPIVTLALALLLIGTAAAQELTDEQVGEFSRRTVFGAPGQIIEALKALGERGNPDVLPSLLLSVRYRGAHPEVLEVFSKLAGEQVTDWKDAMLWQEAHPEIKPHESYRELKLQIFRRIDPLFLNFLGGDSSLPENMKIRLEEITWGGVSVDGIPSLDNPKLIGVADAEYLLDTDLVFGIEINGDARAYPLRIMGWHEMFNDVIGGVPLALAYCTLCGSGILFETQVEGRDKPLVFGSSGFLYRSNKLMFDRQTNSLWNQFTGQPVTGPLLNSGIKLKIRPVVITSWANWKSSHPDTKVLSLDTGHRRNYGSGVVYRDYFASPELMFPTIVRDESVLQRKDYVFGIRDVAASKAWPVSAFAGGKVINDEIGGRNIVLIGDEATRTVRAYERGDREFSVAADLSALNDGGGDWSVGEDALTGPGGEKLPRMPGHIAYWFAWDGYIGIDSELYAPGD